MSSGAPRAARSAPGPLHDDREPKRHAIQRAAVLLTAWPAWLTTLLFYALISVLTTWPIARDPAGTVFGAPGDMTGNITLLRYRDELGVGPLSNAVTPLESAPFGLSLPGAISLPQVMVEGPAQILTALTGSAVLSVNLMILAGLTLTAFTCFLLCRAITGNSWASAVAGLGYGFNPWILERAHGHVHFTHLWALPLILLALLWIRRGGGWRGWVFFAVALAAACYTNTYVSLFAAVTLGGFIIADMGAAALRRSGPRVRQALSRASFSLAILIGVMIPQAFVSLTQADRIDGLLAGTRSAQDLYSYGSRWWEWITPSYRHPVFDTWTAPFLAARQHDSNLGETALYLGAITLALAMVGALVTLAARRRGAPAWTGALGMAVAGLGLLVSLPRGISPFGFEIPMPAALLSQVVEPWRVYARLFAVVALGVAILAAIGLTRLLALIPRVIAPVAAVMIGALVVFDLSITSTSFSAEPTPVYRELAARPGDDPRVEYPLALPTRGEHLAYIFYTQAAGRPLVNGGREGTTGSSFDRRLQDPLSAWTAPALAGLGARWAILHSHIYGGPPPSVGDGYRLVGDFEGSLLYEITADPPPVMAVPGEGFGLPEVSEGGRLSQWLQGRAGTIAVVNSTNRAIPVTLTIPATSFYRPREVRIALDGALLRTTVVPTGNEVVQLTVPPVPPGRTDLEVSTSPGADRAGSLLNNADPRSLSVQFGGITASTPGQPGFRVG